LRFHPDCPHPEGGRLPALIAAVTDADGGFLAIHRTFLTHDGRKADVDPPRATLGPYWGGAVRLDPLAPELVVGEGVESSASAGRLLGLPAWAALSAGNLSALVRTACGDAVPLHAISKPEGGTGGSYLSCQ
jgi:hypothetical protein